MAGIEEMTFIFLGWIDLDLSLSLFTGLKDNKNKI
jgi:hypothetical protein